MRHAQQTVLSVHQAIKGYGGHVSIFPDDQALTEQVREAAQAQTEKVLAALDGPRQAAVTVKAVHGFPVEELISAATDADLIVLGSRGAGGSTGSCWGRSPGRSHTTHPARSPSSRPRIAADWPGRSAHDHRGQPVEGFVHSPLDLLDGGAGRRAQPSVRNGDMDVNLGS